MSTAIAIVDRTSPTDRTYTELDAAYDYFNKELFDGELPGCLNTLTRRRKSQGYFSPGRFCSHDGREMTDEIALNPKQFHAWRPRRFSPRSAMRWRTSKCTLATRRRICATTTRNGRRRWRQSA